MVPPVLIDLLWGIFGGACALGWEAAGRTTNWPWWKVVLAGMPFQIGVGFSIYQLINRAPHFLGGVLWFTASIWTMRVLVSVFYFGEVVPLRTWVACAVVVFATVYDKAIG